MMLAADASSREGQQDGNDVMIVSNKTCRSFLRVVITRQVLCANHNLVVVVLTLLTGDVFFCPGINFEW